MGTISGKNNNKVDMIGFTPQFLGNVAITYKQGSDIILQKNLIILL